MDLAVALRALLFFFRFEVVENSMGIHILRAAADCRKALCDNAAVAMADTPDPASHLTPRSPHHRPQDKCLTPRRSTPLLRSSIYMISSD